MTAVNSGRIGPGVLSCAPMRSSAPVLIALWLLAYAAPSWVLVRFELDRDRIVREDCIQRGVPLAERTCFGQCHLVKELNDLKEKDAEQGAPSTSVKWEPEALAQVEVKTNVPFHAGSAYAGPLGIMPVLDGHVSGPEGVPWG